MIRFVLTDILVLLLHNLGVVVEVVEILHHSERTHFESILFVQLPWLYSHVSPEQVDLYLFVLAHNVGVLQ